MDGTIRVRTAAWFATAVVLSVFATALVMQTWRVDAAPGDTDSTFVPITPCRLFDTRPGEAPNSGKKTPLAAGVGDALVQQVTGNIGNCVGIPAGTVAVAMNVTIVNPTAQSNLRLFPNGAAIPLVSNLNWLPGQSPTPNKVDVKLSNDGKIKLVNFNGTVDVIGDVVGYYTNSTLKELAAKVAVLEASEPFAVSSYNPDEANLTTTPKSYVDVTVSAPVDGQVTVNYSTYIENGTEGAESVCAPFRSTEIPAVDVESEDQGVGFWETAVATDGNGDEGSVSGTARFDIAAGTTITYSLACHQYIGDGAVAGRTMTAIFTPAP